MSIEIRRKYRITLNPSTDGLKRVLVDEWISEDRVQHNNLFDDDGTPWGRCVRKFDDRGNMVEETLYDGDNTIEKRRVCRYDDHGNMVKHTIYRGERDGIPDQYTFQYVYGEGGQVLERREFNKYRMLSKEVIYDDCGRMTRRTTYDNDGKETLKECYVYDADGKLLEEHELCGEEPSKRVYKYDCKGNQIYSYLDKNGIEAAGIRYTYDENNRMVDNRSLIEDGTVIYRESYGYDSEGRKNKQIDYQEDCVTIDTIRTWEYDKGGRIARQCYTDANGVARLIWEYNYNENGDICMECMRKGDDIEELYIYEYEIYS